MLNMQSFTLFLAAAATPALAAAAAAAAATNAVNFHDYQPGLITYAAPIPVYCEGPVQDNGSCRGQLHADTYCCQQLNQGRFDIPKTGLGVSVAPDGVTQDCGQDAYSGVYMCVQ